MIDILAQLVLGGGSVLTATLLVVYAEHFSDGNIDRK